MSRENLLFYQVIKIVYENGTRYLIPGENEGFQKIRSVFSPYLESLGSDHTNVTVSHFRSIFKRSWDDILDELVPYEARDRVTREFKSLIF